MITGFGINGSEETWKICVKKFYNVIVWTEDKEIG